MRIYPRAYADIINAGATYERSWPFVIGPYRYKLERGTWVYADNAKAEEAEGTEPPAGEVQPFDWTDYTARAQIRTAIDAPTSLLDLTTEAGSLILDSVTGALTIKIAPADTTALALAAAANDHHVMTHVEVAKDGDVDRVLELYWTIRPEMTLIPEN